jgi:hypothetical protein
VTGTNGADLDTAIIELDAAADQADDDTGLDVSEIGTGF